MEFKLIKEIGKRVNEMLADADIPEVEELRARGFDADLKLEVTLKPIQPKKQDAFFEFYERQMRS